MAFLSSPALRVSRSSSLRSRATPLVCRPPCMPFPRLPRFRMTSTVGPNLPAEKDAKTMTEDDWRQVLTRGEFHILREKGTEYPGTGEYDGFYPNEGHFQCRACGNPIYSVEAKFKSGCGWPAFDKCYEGAVKTRKDNSLGMRRIEIMCSNCDGHLGHVFVGERMTETNERHCVNSLSLRYAEASVDKQEVKVE